MRVDLDSMFSSMIEGYLKFEKSKLFVCHSMKLDENMIIYEKYLDWDKNSCFKDASLSIFKNCLEDEVKLEYEMNKNNKIFEKLIELFELIEQRKKFKSNNGMKNEKRKLIDSRNGLSISIGYLNIGKFDNVSNFLNPLLEKFGFVDFGKMYSVCMCSVKSKKFRYISVINCCGECHGISKIIFEKLASAFFIDVYHCDFNKSIQQTRWEQYLNIFDLNGNSKKYELVAVISHEFNHFRSYFKINNQVVCYDGYNTVAQIFKVKTSLTQCEGSVLLYKLVEGKLIL